MNGLQVKWLPCRTASPEPNPSLCREQSQHGLVYFFQKGDPSGPRKILALLLLLSPLLKMCRTPVFLSLRTQSVSPFPLLLLPLLLLLLQTIGRVLYLPLPLLMCSPLAVTNQGSSHHRLLVPPAPRESRLRIPRSYTVFVSPRVNANPRPSGRRTSALSSVALQRTTAVWKYTRCRRLRLRPGPGTASGAMTNEVVGPRHPTRRDAAGTANTTTVTVNANVKGLIGTVAKTTVLLLPVTVTARIRLKASLPTGTAGAPGTLSSPRMQAAVAVVAMVVH